MAKEPTFKVDIVISNIPEDKYDEIVQDIVEQIYGIMNIHNVHFSIHVGIGEQE